MGKVTALKVHTPEGMSTHDVSVEQYREYIYPDGAILRIDEPVTLFLKQDGDPRGDSHRVVDANGVTTYPKRGWIGLRWLNKKDGRPVEF